jgi:hypothetical protein
MVVLNGTLSRKCRCRDIVVFTASCRCHLHRDSELLSSLAQALKFVGRPAGRAVGRHRPIGCEFGRDRTVDRRDRRAPWSIVTVVSEQHLSWNVLRDVGPVLFTPVRLRMVRQLFCIIEDSPILHFLLANLRGR